jgi:oligoendopeptidase F
VTVITMNWNLHHIYSSTEAWEADFRQVSELLAQFAEYLNWENGEQLYTLLELDEKASQTVGRLFAFAKMNRDIQNKSSEYQALTQRVQSLGTKLSAATSFIVPSILKMSEESLERLFVEEPRLEHYRKVIERISRRRAHVLSDEQENLLAGMGEITQTASHVFSMLNNADITFEPVEGQKLTQSSYISFMESKDRSIRKQAFENLYAGYDKLKNTIAGLYGSHVKKNVFMAQTKSYPSAVEHSLFSDNVPVSVYDNLIDSVKRNLPAMFKYLSIRKRVLGLNELHMYDLHTSIVQEASMELSYEEAYATMLKGLAPLGEEYIRMLEYARDNEWIDVYEKEGKSSGAYNWGVYGIHPFILLNHKNNLGSMFTLAHEMGHAMHAYHSHKALPYTYAHYTIFTAEVASTVNEALLIRYLLKETTEKQARMQLLTHFLDKFRSTMIRQTMFAEFEKLVHDQAASGEPLTAESLSKLYYGLNQSYFGDDVVVDEAIALEWARIPHFYRSFYVYKYATGFAAAIALSEQILEQGNERYLEFLASGGDDYPIEQLKRAGVDMSSPKPIEDALKLFSSMVDELEALVDGN